jgi:hypothetical protein
MMGFLKANKKALTIGFGITASIAGIVYCAYKAQVSKTIAEELDKKEEEISFDYKPEILIDDSDIDF